VKEKAAISREIHRYFFSIAISAPGVIIGSTQPVTFSRLVTFFRNARVTADRAKSDRVMCCLRLYC
jgi:hypothetical protein